MHRVRERNLSTAIRLFVLTLGAGVLAELIAMWGQRARRRAIRRWLAQRRLVSRAL
jgi:hypothetical protein